MYIYILKKSKTKLIIFIEKTKTTSKVLIKYVF